MIFWLIRTVGKIVLFSLFFAIVWKSSGLGDGSIRPGFAWLMGIAALWAGYNIMRDFGPQKGE